MSCKICFQQNNWLIDGAVTIPEGLFTAAPATVITVEDLSYGSVGNSIQRLLSLAKQPDFSQQVIPLITETMPEIQNNEDLCYYRAFFSLAGKEFTTAIVDYLLKNTPTKNLYLLLDVLETNLSPEDLFEHLLFLGQNTNQERIHEFAVIRLESMFKFSNDWSKEQRLKTFPKVFEIENLPFDGYRFLENAVHSPNLCPEIYPLLAKCFPKIKKSMVTEHAWREMIFFLLPYFSPAQEKKALALLSDFVQEENKNNLFLYEQIKQNFVDMSATQLLEWLDDKPVNSYKYRLLDYLTAAKKGDLVQAIVDQKASHIFSAVNFQNYGQLLSPQNFESPAKAKIVFNSFADFATACSGSFSPRSEWRGLNLSLANNFYQEGLEEEGDFFLRKELTKTSEKGITFITDNDYYLGLKGLKTNFPPRAQKIIEEAYDQIQNSKTYTPEEYFLQKKIWLLAVKADAVKVLEKMFEREDGFSAKDVGSKFSFFFPKKEEIVSPQYYNFFLNQLSPHFLKDNRLQWLEQVKGLLPSLTAEQKELTFKWLRKKERVNYNSSQEMINLFFSFEKNIISINLVKKISNQIEKDFYLSYPQRQKYNAALRYLGRVINLKKKTPFGEK